MNLQNAIKRKKAELYEYSLGINKGENFFYKSILHHIISLEIACQNNLGGISYEEICKYIPNIIGSRSSIQSILNDGLDLKLFEKTPQKTDLRIKKYTLSKDYEMMTNNWITKQKEIFVE